MRLSALCAFLHFVAVFGILGTVFIEWQTMSPAPTLLDARRIQLSDKWFGILAGVVLIVGFLRAIHFEKSWACYSSNLFFHTKLGLFVLIGLLSIYPTIRFLKWRKQTKQGEAPVVAAGEYWRIMLVLRVELVLLLGMALCASLMARGVGV